MLNDTMVVEHALSACSAYVVEIFRDPKRLVSMGGLFFLVFSASNALLYRRHLAVREALLLLAPSLAGVWLGGIILSAIPPAWVLAVATAILWVASVRRLSFPRAAVPKPHDAPLSRRILGALGAAEMLAAGGVSGLLQGAGMKSGPVRVAYLAARLRVPQAIIATSAVVSTANLTLATAHRLTEGFITFFDVALMAVAVAPVMFLTLAVGKRRVVDPNGTHRWVPNIITVFVFGAALLITGVWLHSV